MNKYLFFILFWFLAILPLSADKHPKAAEIRGYADDNPIEPRIPEIMIYISLKSEELNAEGYDLYLKKRYREAISRFDEAVRYDEDNSFAWYNMACCYALLGDDRKTALNLKEAVRRDWFWGLMLMVDPDLDGVRRFGISYQYAEYDPWGDPVFIHDLKDKGTVDFMDNQAGSPRKLGTGYYCIVYSDLFEFFPYIDSYAVEGPNGPIHTPESWHQSRVPDISLK